MQPIRYRRLVIVATTFIASLICLAVSMTNMEKIQDCQLVASAGQSQKTNCSDGCSLTRGKEVEPEDEHDIRELKLEVKKDVFTLSQMEVCEQYLFHIDKFHEKISISELGLHALTSKSHAMVYNDLLTHRYDSYRDLRSSAGYMVDQERCLSQLTELVDRAERAKKEKFSGKDVNFHRLLDTWGRIPAGLFMGSSFWPGIYDECIQFKVIPTRSRREPIQTRYCIASLKHKLWPKGGAFAELLSLKTGICLPETCDSLKYKNKYELIDKLMEFNMREVDKGESYIDNIYCVPDSRSPLRNLWMNPKSLVAALVLGVWIAVLLYSTIRYELHRYKSYKFAQRKEPSEGVGLSVGFKLEDKADNSTVTARGDEYMNIYEMLAITNNLRLLFSTSKASALMEGVQKTQVKEADSSDDETKSQEEANANKRDSNEPIVDLRCLEGIKVICMSYVIIGHVLMCMTAIISNGRSIGKDFSMTFFMANMMPAFAVNSFFAITGLLTSYLLFKQNKSHSFITSPLKWFAFIMYRYLRIMPMYLVVVFYSKYLAKYTGSGPMWDYGTSSLGARRQCENESWLWTLLFAANFKHPLEHCIPSAWYLANDFQFFMLTPLLLALLYRRPTLGRVLLQVGVLAGFLAGMYSIFYSDAPDLRPVARFWPHGFKTYITFLTAVYTRPQYRIPAYLCGLLFGHALHEYEQKKLAYRRAIAAKPELSQFLVEPNWSPLFLRFGLMASVFLVTLCALIPVVGNQIEFNRFFAKLTVAFTMSLYHVLFALAIGFYILLSTTGNGNQFINNILSAPAFKPLSRLSLCVVLINVEVCTYIIQSHRHQKHIDSLEQNALNLLSIVVSYLAAIVLCVLFEAPIRSALNKVLTTVLARAAQEPAKQKAQ